MTSRNKRSLALDLKHPDGIAVLHRLVAVGRCVRHQLSVAGARRLQLAPAHLLPLNPRLIYASFTAYGEAGDEAAKTGFDSTAYWARTGLMDQVRAEPTTVPARSMPGMGDHPSATGLYAAIVTALYRREKTGQGGVVSRRCCRTVCGRMAAPCRPACSASTCRTGPPASKRRTRWPTITRRATAAGSSWRCSTSSGSCAAFLAAIGREELTDDPRFATPDARKQNAGELVKVLDAVFATRDLAEWRAILDGVGVTFGIVGTVDEVLDDPADARQRRAGAVRGRRAADRIDAVPDRRRGEGAGARAPALGQHSEAVLREAGYAADEIARLRGLGVLA